jgi:hypothetical protein
MKLPERNRQIDEVGAEMDRVSERLRKMPQPQRTPPFHTPPQEPNFLCELPKKLQGLREKYLKLAAEPVEN